MNLILSQPPPARYPQSTMITVFLVPKRVDDDNVIRSPSNTCSLYSLTIHIVVISYNNIIMYTSVSVTYCNAYIDLNVQCTHCTRDDVYRGNHCLHRYKNGSLLVLNPPKTKNIFIIFVVCRFSIIHSIVDTIVIWYNETLYKLYIIYTHGCKITIFNFFQ